MEAWGHEGMITGVHEGMRFAVASSADTPLAEEIGRAAMKILEVLPGVTVYDVLVKGWEDEPMLLFADNGSGMSDEQLDRLFQPFHEIVPRAPPHGGAWPPTAGPVQVATPAGESMCRLLYPSARATARTPRGDRRPLGFT